MTDGAHGQTPSDAPRVVGIAVWMAVLAVARLVDVIVTGTPEARVIVVVSCDDPDEMTEVRVSADDGVDVTMIVTTSSAVAVTTFVIVVANPEMVVTAVWVESEMAEAEAPLFSETTSPVPREGGQ